MIINYTYYGYLWFILVKLFEPDAKWGSNNFTLIITIFFLIMLVWWRDTLHTHEVQSFVLRNSRHC